MSEQSPLERLTADLNDLRASHGGMVGGSNEASQEPRSEDVIYATLDELGELLAHADGLFPGLREAIDRGGRVHEIRRHTARVVQAADHYHQLSERLGEIAEYRLFGALELNDQLGLAQSQASLVTAIAQKVDQSAAYARELEATLRRVHATSAERLIANCLKRSVADLGAEEPF